LFRDTKNKEIKSVEAYSIEQFFQNISGQSSIIIVLRNGEKYITKYVKIVALDIFDITYILKSVLNNLNLPETKYNIP